MKEKEMYMAIILVRAGWHYDWRLERGWTRCALSCRVRGGDAYERDTVFWDLFDAFEKTITHD